MTIEPITEQQLLNLNWEWFGWHPERRATVPGSRIQCQYRLEDPSDPRGWRGCAIGNWMPDAVYNVNMENSIMVPNDREDQEPYQVAPTIENVVEHFPLAREWLRECREDFLWELQESHDNYLMKSADEHRQAISRIAYTFGLVDPTVTP